MERPIDVNITNRSEMAATAVGVTLGTLGLLITFIVAAVILSLAVIVAIPVVLIALGWFAISRWHGQEAVYQDALKRLGMEDPT